MQERILPNGNMRLLKPAYGPGVRGDAYVEIGPDDPDYSDVLQRFKRTGQSIEPEKRDVIDLLQEAFDKLTRDGKTDEADALILLATDQRALENHFSSELAAIDAQYQKALAKVEKALQERETGQLVPDGTKAKTKKTDQATPNHDPKPAVRKPPSKNVKPTPKPKKGKKPKGE